MTITAYGSCSSNATRIHLVHTGVCFVIAEQPGNDEYNPATSVTQQFFVGKKAHSKKHHV